MLEAIGLSKQYGAHAALTDLNLTIDRGEVFCLLGANGAGKTTTIGTRVGIMKHGRLVATMQTRDIGHADLERIYLDHMRD